MMVRWDSSVVRRPWGNNDGESSVVRRLSSVGECGIIDLDFIIPIQPETI